MGTAKLRYEIIRTLESAGVALAARQIGRRLEKRFPGITPTSFSSARIRRNLYSLQGIKRVKTSGVDYRSNSFLWIAPKKTTRITPARFRELEEKYLNDQEAAELFDEIRALGGPLCFVCEKRTARYTTDRCALCDLELPEGERGEKING